MTRKTGRKTARTKTKVAEAEEVHAPAKALKPAQCRGFMRKRLAEEFPHIVHGFVREATMGSCAHVKLASELLERTPTKRATRRKSSAEQMLKELEQL